MEFFQHIWGQALTTVAGAEEEAEKLLLRFQGISQDELRKLGERLVAQRTELEHRFDDVVKTSLGRLQVPRRDQVAELNARLDGLAKRVEALQK